ncbi:MAG TPA: hypothetical protein ACHBZ9_16295 [Arsenophonus nasoniae]|uniref:SpaN/EivJ family type III secretion system needle length determinant n=1 Tax=Arsenophonus nasoniae TaxID=638 RepID=UPI003878FBEE
MVNIDTHQPQQIISSSSYLPDNPCTRFSSSDCHNEQINNTYLSKAIDERLTLLQSILVSALPTEITVYDQQQEQQELPATELVIPINLPFSNIETTNFFRSSCQPHSITVDTDQKSYPINQRAIEKQTLISDTEENQPISVKIKLTTAAKHHDNNRLVLIEEETVAKSFLTAGDTHLKSTSHQTVKEDDLSPTIINELNNIELAEQENCQSVTDNSNNLANSDSSSPFASWPTLPTAASYQNNTTAELPAKTATTAMPFNHSLPEAELRYTFTQWQGTHHVDIYRITNHHLQLMASNSHVMSILQRHLNERASPSAVSLFDTLNITLNNSDESGDESS